MFVGRSLAQKQALALFSCTGTHCVISFDFPPLRAFLEVTRCCVRHRFRTVWLKSPGFVDRGCRLGFSEWVCPRLWTLSQEGEDVRTSWERGSWRRAPAVERASQVRVCAISYTFVCVPGQHGAYWQLVSRASKVPSWLLQRKKQRLLSYVFNFILLQGAPIHWFVS